MGLMKAHQLLAQPLCPRTHRSGSRSEPPGLLRAARTFRFTRGSR